MKTKYDSEKIETALVDLIKLIEQKYKGVNPFEQLEKGLRIVKTRNYRYYISISKHFREIAYILYDNGVTDSNIFAKIDELKELLKTDRNIK